MAVAHSAASESHTGTTGSTNQASFSWTHTQTGTPQGVIVFVSTFASLTDLITSVTYGGVALTRLAGGSAQDTAGELGRLDAFFLGSGLSAGNQTITVNRTNDATSMYASAATVTAGANTAVPTTTIVLLQGDGDLTVQSVNDTSPGQNSVRYAGSYFGLNLPPVAGGGSTLLNNIDIGSYGSALVRETTAGQGARNVGFASAFTDDRAAIHLAIRELVPRTETPIVGTYTLTGRPANARHNVRIESGTGAFSLAGNDATLAKATASKAITVETGTFVLAGGAPSLSAGYHLDPTTGTFSLTANAAGLTKSDKLAAETGAFTLNGQQATLLKNHAIIAETGTFVVTGEPATLRHAPRIEAATESFALTGGAPALLRGRYLSGGPGEFIETGQPSTFRRTWVIRPTTGTFALTGNPAALVQAKAYEIAPGVGTFAFTGQPSALRRNYAVASESGTFAVTGNAATFRQGQLLSAATGTFALSGNAAQLSRNRLFTAETGTFAFTGADALLVKSRRRSVLIF